MDIYSQLRRDEGIRLKPYVDTAGKITIGVGRNLTDNGLSDSEINILLTNDIAEVIHDLTISGYPCPNLTDPRTAALINMCFNLGITRLLKFHNMLAAYKAGNWPTVASEMMNSSWAAEVKSRAQRLSIQMATGVWT